MVIFLATLHLYSDLSVFGLTRSLAEKQRYYFLPYIYLAGGISRLDFFAYQIILNYA